MSKKFNKEKSYVIGALHIDQMNGDMTEPKFLSRPKTVTVSGEVLHGTEITNTSEYLAYNPHGFKKNHTLGIYEIGSDNTLNFFHSGNPLSDGGQAIVKRKRGGDTIPFPAPNLRDQIQPSEAGMQAYKGLADNLTKSKGQLEDEVSSLRQQIMDLEREKADVKARLDLIDQLCGDDINPIEAINHYKLYLDNPKALSDGKEAWINGLMNLASNLGGKTIDVIGNNMNSDAGQKSMARIMHKIADKMGGSEPDLSEFDQGEQE